MGGALDTSGPWAQALTRTLACCFVLLIPTPEEYVRVALFY